MPTKLGEEYTYLDEVFYFRTNGEFIPFEGIAEVTISEPVEDRIVSFLPRHREFTATIDISPRQSNKIRRMLNKIMRREMRIARYHKRLKEKIRRGILKGEAVVKIGRPDYFKQNDTITEYL